MATFPAVAANLMQTSPSPGATPVKASGETSESFSSHLKAATGKQEKPQAGSQAQEQPRATNIEENSKQVAQKQTDSKEPVVHQENEETLSEDVTTQNEEAESSSQDDLAAESSTEQQPIAENTQESKKKESPADDAPDEETSSQQTALYQATGSKESVLARMLDQITTPRSNEAPKEQTIRIVSSDNASLPKSSVSDFTPLNLHNPQQQTDQPTPTSEWSQLVSGGNQPKNQAPPQQHWAQQTTVDQGVNAGQSVSVISQEQQTTSPQAAISTAHSGVQPGQETISLQVTTGTTEQVVQAAISTAHSGGQTGQETISLQVTTGTTEQVVQAAISTAHSGGQAGQEPRSLQATTGATVIFTPQDGTITTRQQVQQQGENILKAPESALFFQNSDGQSISIEQGKNPLQPQVLTTALSGNQTLHQKGANLDFNGRYIHSHLLQTPGTAVAAANQSMTSDQSQADLFSGGNQDFKGMPGQEQPSLFQEGGFQTLGHTTGFGMQLSSSQMTTFSAPTSGTETTYYQLGSGTLVPDTAVVDQMIAQFSANKRLETSTLNLKLHPQELGELRLEIKVEQDNVKAHIVTQSPHSQEMLDRHMPKLREALEQQGLHLQDIEVSVADGNTGFEEQFANNSGWQQSQQSMTSKTTRSDFSIELNEEAGEEEDVETNFNAIA
nr:flagellar hook-length control protein FliK [uncultured Desulfobulbus sp.]